MRQVKGKEGKNQKKTPKRPQNNNFMNSKFPKPKPCKTERTTHAGVTVVVEQSLKEEENPI